MSITKRDKNILQNLAKRIAEIATLPEQQEKKDMWIRLNRLERVRPLIHVQALAKSLWNELLPDDELQTKDTFCRSQERKLRRNIYCWENFHDDRVVDNIVVCPIAIQDTGWGIEVNEKLPDHRFGAKSFNPVIIEERDIDKIKTPKISVDWKETDRHYSFLCEIYDGILVVEKRGKDFFWFQIMDLFIRWRGIDQMFIDLIERPEWVHEALERITQGYINILDQMEELNLLSLSNGNTRLGSGGYGFTDQLPQPGFDGEHVRTKDMWARAATQIFTEIISPEMHEEFAIRYEKRLLERFGLSCYGCCEPLHKKMHIVRTIKNLRRVSMSPWVDVEIASAEVDRDYVYTHKPNPTMVSMESWDPDLARGELRDTFEKTMGNIVEVSLQDLHTVRNEPNRLIEWAKIAMQLAEKYV